MKKKLLKFLLLLSLSYSLTSIEVDNKNFNTDNSSISNTSFLSISKNNTENNKSQSENKNEIFKPSSNRNSTCLSSKDCSEDYICSEQTKTCTHKDFFPIEPKQIIMVIIICFCCAISTGSGTGGGAIIVTTLMSLNNFSTHDAVPISVVTILICCITTYFMGAKAKLEYNDYLFVDYDIILVCCPLILFGVKVGTILNVVFPSTLIMGILITLLLFNSLRLYSNAKILKLKEDVELKNSLLVEYHNENFEIKVERDDKVFDLDLKKIKEKIQKVEEDSYSYSVYTNPNQRKKEIELSEYNEKSNENDNKSDYGNLKFNLNLSKIKEEFNIRSLLQIRKSKSIKKSLSINDKPNQIPFKSTLEMNPINSEIENNLNYEIKKDELHEIFHKNLENSDYDDNTIRADEEALDQLIEKVKEIELIKSDILYENNPIRLNRLRTLGEFIAFLLLVEVILGSKTIPSIVGIEICSFEYFFILSVFGILCFTISSTCFEQVKKEEEISDLFSSVLLSEEQILIRKGQFSITRLSDSSKTKLKVLSFLCGLICSTTGVGGGIIMSPIFI